MEAKIVVGTKDGKSYNVEVKDDLAAVFIGKRVGDTVSVTPLGLKGYEVKITGGSDNQGFPIRKDLHKAGRGKALMSSRTVGYRPKKEGIRARKTVVGDIIDENISQINTVVVKEGKDSIDKLLGLGAEAPVEGEAAPAEAPKEAPKEEAPAEEKPEEKPEEKAEEKVEEKPAE
jgi:small subunit ribosomal protein S6e